MKYASNRTPPPQKHRSRLRAAFTVLCLLFIASVGIAAAAGAKGPHLSPAAKVAAAAHTIAPAIPKNTLSTTLPAALAAVMKNHDGSVDVAVYDHATGQTIHYTNAGAGTTYNTASIVKLSILEELLLQDQAAGTGITSDQLAEATPMIENSDNDAATALWDEVGDGSTMQSFFGHVGATSTTVDPADHWGLTQTTALDQLKIVNQFAYPGSSTLLNSTSVATIVNLLSNVETDQHWGISGGVPASATVLLKNGWLEDTDGWDVNSIGHVQGGNTDYTVAILSDQDDTESSGIATVQALSTAVYSSLAAA